MCDQKAYGYVFVKLNTAGTQFNVENTLKPKESIETFKAMLPANEPRFVFVGADQKLYLAIWLPTVAAPASLNSYSANVGGMSGVHSLDGTVSASDLEEFNETSFPA
ncbi:hypothetical protein SAMD00019534_028370 [Acytostelium subglobosum LB1]|uniref:hypothetical protein n=1 Tax=Acytostelium subglobosum LB1 TaxID=1410327 RepID=UPI0006450B89|nr:hypothetical protein SAMD00019534_028370 [Acytostelium subglobosum LB1]GAM19662.1 hypothetical protein SAMD00019534_028370 [Acytostelium subglobosum LB1]|eukprot:XP_012756424.1 hypothetical protein SAMD00019534_028370 [Acytostelium subglobosum LB1]